MPITGTQQAPPFFRETSSDTGRHLAHRMEKYLGENEAGYRRIARIRQAMIHSPANCHPIDRRLGMAEQYKSPTIRSLIHVANCLEEVAEACADVSSLTERLVRNTISSGEKADLALIVSSAIARVATGYLNLFGFSVHKVSGAGLYALSTLVSLSVVGLSKTPLGAHRSPERIAQIHSENPRSIGLYEPIARTLLKHKENLLYRVLDKVGQSEHSKTGGLISKWARRHLRNCNSVPSHNTALRKTNCSYMLKHLHQYGRVTQSLMHIGYNIFFGVNKVLVSFDKHIATAAGEHLLARRTGSVLGCRLGFTASVGAAAGISVPMSALLVGISTVGAIACGVAIISLLLARANVYFFKDWKGNIRDPDLVKFLAR